MLVGAGYISLEFAGIFNGMGKDVHIVYRKALPLVGYDSSSFCKHLLCLLLCNYKASHIHLSITV